MKKILSVGQCLADQTRISQVLQSRYQAQFDTADTSEELVALLESSQYDLVLINRLLDHNGVQGLDLIRQIKSNPATRNVQVMLVSNIDDAQQQAMALGAANGFGKADLNDASLGSILDPFLAS